MYDSAKEEEPLGMYIMNPTSNRVSDRPHILGRIIEHLDMVFVQWLDDQEMPLQTIYLPWGEEDQYTNTCMAVDVLPHKLMLTFSDDGTTEWAER